MSPVLRRKILTVHRWAGLTLGLVLAWMAITGAMMVFRVQLDPLANPGLLTTPICTDRVPLDALADAARAAHPVGRIDYIRVLGGDRQPTLIRFANKDTVYLNPCTGTVLGMQNRYGGLFGTIELLHRLQFLGFGHWITGVSAIIFVVVFAVGGILVWWPHSLRALKGALRFNTRLTGRGRSLNRHRTIGVYVSLIVMTSALTGLPQAFDWYKNGVYRIAGSPPPEAPPKASESSEAPLPMETFWRHVQTLSPHPRETLLHYPLKSDDPVEIYIIGRDAPHANARTYLFLDPHTDAVLRYTPYNQSSLGHRLYFWTLSIHTGQAGGVIGQLLLLGGALSVPYLAYTGIGSYLRRKFKTSTSAPAKSIRPSALPSSSAKS